MAACKNCKNFIADQVGDAGLGQCEKYNEYKSKTSNVFNLQNARMKLGNAYNSDVFWPGDGRECEKYVRN